MANEVLITDLITVGNAVSAVTGKAFVNGAAGLPLVHAEVFPNDTNLIKFAVEGSLTAETVGEATDYSYSASSDYNETSISCTAKKSVLGTKITVEAARFGAGRARLERIAELHGAAHARLFDSDLKALFSGIATGVTAATTLIKDNLIDARYNVVASMKGAFSGKLVGMFDYKGVSEIQKELTSITASAFGNMEMLGILGMPNPGNGYAGSIVGIDIYQTDGLPTSGGDDVACVWDPTSCFAAGVDGRDGLNNTLKDPAAINGLSTEILTWTWFKIVEWRDTAGCRVLSDT